MLGLHIRSLSQYWLAIFLLGLLTEVFPAGWGKCGLRGVLSAPEEVQSASSPAGVSVEFSLLAGPVGKTGDQIIFDRPQGMKARQSACLFP